MKTPPLLAAMLVACLPTRVLIWRLKREGLPRFWWMEIVKELARRGEIEDVRLVEVKE